jgi:hypothetical protein
MEMPNKEEFILLGNVREQGSGLVWVEHKFFAQEVEN